ncbi:hypothetical protein ABXZ88_003216 [Vibrio fluvialis]
MSNPLVRPLTPEEVARFESAEQNERKIAKSYGKFSEFDSIQEGLWIMKQGRFSVIDA